MLERTYLLTVGIIALIFIVSMTIPFASILIGAVLQRHARWKEIVLVSSLGSATGGNRRLVLALKSGWSMRKRWRSSWRKATGLSSFPSPSVSDRVRAMLGQTCTQLRCARFQSARDRTCLPYAKIVQLDQSRTNRSSAAATASLSPHFVFQDLTQYQE
jgi:hypothetical protein